MSDACRNWAVLQAYVLEWFGDFTRSRRRQWPQHREPVAPKTRISSTCSFALLCPESLSHLPQANICLFLRLHPDIICPGNFPWLPLKTKFIITSSVPPLWHVRASGAALLHLCSSGFGELNVCPTIWGLNKAGETLSDSSLSLGPPVVTGRLGADAQQIRDNLNRKANGRTTAQLSTVLRTCHTHTCALPEALSIRPGCRGLQLRGGGDFKWHLVLCVWTTGCWNE